ncbi:PREDICTED: GON-4-like protein [Lepidothrix coronata]|uniref:GON-4-like protein n=1 Tax=Lepidothrix coronata TaxID=321398 RepID=A0A6J0GPP2_9PASS|nr:PREDICTED: GON-4-like protein [Lepidothrix coronata]
MYLGRDKVLCLNFAPGHLTTAWCVLFPGKIPKLFTEVEVSSQRDPHPTETPESPGRSSLQGAGRNPATTKPPKNTRAEEQDGEDPERRKRRRKATKRKREGKSQEEEGPLSCDIKLDDTLDRTLEDGAKQHNLTVVNVRNILHEVITNEHVVAMMKAAISETEDIPLFVTKVTQFQIGAEEIAYEADDDDDPEYNFLEDLDEPDTEDFRNDRAVRITKEGLPL